MGQILDAVRTGIARQICDDLEAMAKEEETMTTDKKDGFLPEPHGTQPHVPGDIPEAAIVTSIEYATSQPCRSLGDTVAENIEHERTISKLYRMIGELQSERDEARDLHRKALTLMPENLAEIEKKVRATECPSCREGRCLACRVAALPDPLQRRVVKLLDAIQEAKLPRPSMEIAPQGFEEDGTPDHVGLSWFDGHYVLVFTDSTIQNGNPLGDSWVGDILGVLARDLRRPAKPRGRRLAGNNRAHEPAGFGHVRSKP